jgi:hypothetical protein
VAATEDQGRAPTKTLSSEAPLRLLDICTRALAQRKVTEARSVGGRRGVDGIGANTINLGA